MDNRPKTIEERRQAYKDKLFNKYHNEPARIIILQKTNQMLREELNQEV